MTESAVANAIKNWGPRFIQSGVDYNDYLRTVAGIETWEGWLDPWVALGERHEALAREAEAKGNKVTAGEAFARASIAYHFGCYLWVLDRDRYAEIVKRSVDTLRDAHRFLDPSAERIEVPFDKAYIAGNLRRPSGVDRPPLVILVPGLDSTKEEFFNWENSFLQRGMATFAMDGPGQGESGLELMMDPTYERAVTAMIDVLEKRSDLDCTRIGIIGVSSGGYYAPRAAAFEKRITAVCTNGGVYDHSRNWDGYPPMIIDKLLFDHRTKDKDAARELAAKHDTRPIIHLVDQPFLLIHSDHDWAYPWKFVEPIAKAAPNCEVVIIDGGNHANGNYPYLWRPLVADWMRGQLKA